MRRALPYVLALVLGAGASVLAACGGEGPDDGIPAANAEDLKKELSDVEDFVDRGDCGSELDGQLRQVREELDALPASVNAELVARLRDGISRLETAAVQECGQDDDQETTEEMPETVTEQVPTVTETQPPVETEPPPTQTQPPAEEPPPAEPAPEPPGQGQGPGSGGTEPELVP